MNDTSPGSLSPINYLKIFFRRKNILIVLAFTGLILGVCAGILLPKEYMSSTIILVQEGKSDNPLFDKLAVSTTVQQRMNIIRESILSWNNLVQLVERLNLDKNVKTAHDFEQLIIQIRQRIHIKMRQHNVIRLSYVGRDPVETQAVVKTITDIFIERNVAIQNEETADAITFIEEQLKVYLGKIKSAEIARLEDQLNTLLADSTDKHPTVRKLREEIELKKNEMEDQNLTYTVNENLKTQSTNPIITEIKSALDSLEAKKQVDGFTTPETDMYKLMLIDKLDDAMAKTNVMARDVKVNAGLYNMLLQRLETAKITQRLQSSKEGTKYTILDPPRIPFEPIKPDRILLALMGLVGGGGIGIFFIVLLEFLDKSFIDVEDAKDYLGVPLLGAISKITTDESIRNEKEKTRWVYSLTALGGVVLIILTATISNFLK